MLHAHLLASRRSQLAANPFLPPPAHSVGTRRAQSAGSARGRTVTGLPAPAGGAAVQLEESYLHSLAADAAFGTSMPPVREANDEAAPGGAADGVVPPTSAFGSCAVAEAAEVAAPPPMD